MWSRAVEIRDNYLFHLENAMTDKDIKDAIEKRREDEDTGVTETVVRDETEEDTEEDDVADESTDDDDIPF